MTGLVGSITSGDFVLFACIAIDGQLSDGRREGMDGCSGAEGVGGLLVGCESGSFVINRRHQRLATASPAPRWGAMGGWFPINRRHQRLATRALRALVLQAASRASARSTIMPEPTTGSKPVENTVNPCYVWQRAAQRCAGPFEVLGCCALRSRGPPTA